MIDKNGLYTFMNTHGFNFATNLSNLVFSDASKHFSFLAQKKIVIVIFNLLVSDDERPETEYWISQSNWQASS